MKPKQMGYRLVVQVSLSEALSSQIIVLSQAHSRQDISEEMN